jgi:hypothetical protein
MTFVPKTLLGGVAHLSRVPYFRILGRGNQSSLPARTSNQTSLPWSWERGRSDPKYLAENFPTLATIEIERQIGAAAARSRAFCFQGKVPQSIKINEAQ